tara:strand:+ start:213 stop:593 length:381 start_codon:yes stop_codon:yes gene_type:complete
MSVRVVRTRNGEDVIADIREIHPKEGDPQVLGFQLNHPYVIWISDGMQAEDDDGNIHKITGPEITMEPWAPLAKEQQIIVRIDEVISAYETHDGVLEKYQELVEARTTNEVTTDGEDSTVEERESD